MRKWLSIVLVSMLILSFLPCAAQAEVINASLNPGSITVIVGQTSAAFKWPDAVIANVADMTGVQWNTSSTYCTRQQQVNHGYTFKATMKGTYDITATITMKDNVVYFCSGTLIAVDTPVEAASVTLNKTSLTLEIAGTDTLTATVLPADTMDKRVWWSSSDEAIATVDDGEVTAVAAGTATITATTANNKTATCAVTVNAPPVPVDSVTLDEASLILRPGDSATLTATVLPADATDKTLTWASSDASVATVSGGVVTGVADGECTITATSKNNKSASCEVTVSDQHDHEWEKIAEVPATCTEDGHIEFRCECGEMDVDILPALGHWYGEWTSKDDAIHTAACKREGCKHVAERPCEKAEITFLGVTATYCPVCGKNSVLGAIPLVAKATVGYAGQGEAVMRAIAPGDGSTLISVDWEIYGASPVGKDGKKPTGAFAVVVPLDVKDAKTLVYLGDGSEIPFTLSNGALSFTAPALGMYALK